MVNRRPRPGCNLTAPGARCSVRAVRLEPQYRSQGGAPGGSEPVNAAPWGEPAAAKSHRRCGRSCSVAPARILWTSWLAQRAGRAASVIGGLGGLSAAALQAANREIAAGVDRLLDLDLGSR